MKLAVTATLLLAVSLSAGGADGLRATYDTLRPKFASSPFGRPLVLESAENGGKVEGEVFALVRYSFSQVRARLDTPAEWCEVLILHLNVKACVPSRTANPGTLHLTFGRKLEGSDAGGHPIDFRFNVVASGADRFEVAMLADQGPLGTHGYRLSLEATPVAAGQSFLHLSYAYAYSATARVAMSTYLHTLGKDKVGFTVTGQGADGAPLYVSGVRGALERNTMRYYLGIEAFLASPPEPLAARRAARLSAWFDATEAYPRQLHELTKAEYLAAKQPGRPGGVSDNADTP